MRLAREMLAAEAEMDGEALPPFTPVSRAVRRMVEAGNTAMCYGCGEKVKFMAKRHLTKVIANVYEDGLWARVEHWHPGCYERAGYPHGPSGSIPAKRPDRRIGTDLRA